MDLKSEEERLNAISAPYEQLSKSLFREEFPTGEMRELALKVLDIDYDEGFAKIFNPIVAKLKEGQELTSYQYMLARSCVDEAKHKEIRLSSGWTTGMGRRHAHITRRLKKGEPLKGKTLELALEYTENNGTSDLSKLLRNIGNKFKAGEPLNEYEFHIMVDVILPQSRL